MIAPMSVVIAGIGAFYLSCITFNLTEKVIITHMDISLLGSSSTTTLFLKHPVTEETLSVSITGITPDSKEWKKIEKDVVGPNKKQSLIIEKGKQSIELDSDGMIKREEILRRAIKSIDGIESKGAPVVLNEQVGITAHLNDPQYGWMLEQWGDHLDDRSHFFGSSEKTANSGSSASVGSKQEKTD